jgi:hypothetical protein
MRSHKVATNRKWGTLTDGPETTYVLVPMEDIDAMSAEEIGGTVKSLLDQARITRVHSLLGSRGYLQPTCGKSSNPNSKYVNFCVDLANGAGMEREIFSEMEQLKDLDEELSVKHSEICNTMDETLSYLRNKRSKLTPGQVDARKAILEMRHGCDLCGLLDGRHTAACTRLKNH